MPKEKKPIKIENKALASIVDGHQIFVNNDNGDATIMFFQTFPASEKDEFIEATTVANIRLSNDRLKYFAKSLQEVIDEYEKKGTKKKQ